MSEKPVLGEGKGEGLRPEGRKTGGRALGLDMLGQVGIGDDAVYRDDRHAAGGGGGGRELIMLILMGIIK